LPSSWLVNQRKVKTNNSKNMVNKNHPVDIPETYTVAYYNQETDQNLTAEE
jgi:hypothetical protein